MSTFVCKLLDKVYKVCYDKEKKEVKEMKVAELKKRITELDQELDDKDVIVRIHPQSPKARDKFGELMWVLNGTLQFGQRQFVELAARELKD